MGQYNDEPVSLGNAEAIAETTDALKVRLDAVAVGDDHELWFPKSSIHDDSEVYDVGHEGDFVVKQWIAEEKGLV